MKKTYNIYFWKYWAFAYMKGFKNFNDVPKFSPLKTPIYLGIFKLII